MDEETPEEMLQRIGVSLKRWQAWINAAEAHVWPKPGSILYLAGVAKAWREYEILKADRLFEKHGEPVKPKPDEFTELELRTRAEIFEALLRKALDLKDHKFCNRLAEAFKIPDDKISCPLSEYGVVICEWKELGGLEGKRPSKQAIRRRIESITGGKDVTDRHWDRIWTDPFVSALLRCR